MFEFDLRPKRGANNKTGNFAAPLVNRKLFAVSKRETMRISGLVAPLTNPRTARKQP